MVRNAVPSDAAMLPSRFTISAAALGPMVRQLGGHGIDAVAFLARHSLSLAQVSRGERVPFENICGIWMSAANCSGDEYIGLHSGRLAFEPASLSRRSCDELLELACSHLRSLSPSTYCYVLSGAAETSVVVEGCGHCEAGAEERRHAMDFMVAALFAPVQSQLVNKASQVQVFLPRGSAVDDDEYARAFGCEVVFGGERAGFTICSTAMEATLDRQHQDLGVVAEVRRCSMDRKLGDDLQQVIAASLAEGTMSLEYLAKQLSISARTLQRRLRDEGTTHRALVEEVRCRQAHNMLRTTNVPIYEIAKRLGFADAVAFHRAFRRWMGTTPGSYRSTVHQSAAPARCRAG
jgi:AraC-like DNA-binding protein